MRGPVGYGLHRHHGYGGPCCCGPADCGPGFPFGGHFPDREERISWLEQYLQDLQSQVKAIEERLAEIKAGK